MRPAGPALSHLPLAALRLCPRKSRKPVLISSESAAAPGFRGGADCADRGVGVTSGRASSSSGNELSCDSGFLERTFMVATSIWRDQHSAFAATDEPAGDKSCHRVSTPVTVIFSCCAPTGRSSPTRKGLPGANEIALRAGEKEGHQQRYSARGRAPGPC